MASLRSFIWNIRPHLQTVQTHPEYLGFQAWDILALVLKNPSPVCHLFPPKTVTHSCIQQQIVFLYTSEPRSGCNWFLQAPRTWLTVFCRYPSLGISISEPRLGVVFKCLVSVQPLYIVGKSSLYFMPSSISHIPFNLGPLYSYEASIYWSVWFLVHKGGEGNQLAPALTYGGTTMTKILRE